MSNPNASAEATAIAASSDVTNYFNQIQTYTQQVNSYNMQITQMTQQLAQTQTNLTAAQTALTAAQNNYQTTLVAILNGFSSAAKGAVSPAIQMVPGVKPKP
jgi:flagellar biosynthesis chaperone FliJ